MTIEPEMKTDVVIVGAGPVGLFAAFECGMLGLKTCLVDALPAVGGQCTALYPEKPIYDIPALPIVTAAELIERLVKQMAPFSPEVLCGNDVASLTRRIDGRWSIGLSSGLGIDCGAVILATGAGQLRPNKPDWTGLERFEGKGVHYSVLHKDRFAGRRIIITGGGDSAADWAFELAQIARSIHLIHRREKFRAAPETLQKIQRLVAAGSLEVLAPAKVLALGGNECLQTMEVEIAGERKVLECDDALLFFGLTTQGSPYLSWGLETQGNEVVINAKTCSTNLPGVFAVGDVAVRPSKLKLILSGFSEAATAAHQAFPFCRPGEELFPEYSTAKGLPEVA